MLGGIIKMSGMIAREMAGSNVKLVPGMVTGPVSLYDEWLKWLAYESKKENIYFV